MASGSVSKGIDFINGMLLVNGMYLTVDGTLRQNDALSARNLFDKTLYAYTSYSPLTEVSRQYALRPRTLLAGVFFHF